MRVTTYNLDGERGDDAELTRDSLSQLRVDGEPVLAVSLWGSKVALTLISRLVLIDITSYGRLTQYGGLVNFRRHR